MVPYHTYKHTHIHTYESHRNMQRRHYWRTFVSVTNCISTDWLLYTPNAEAKSFIDIHLCILPKYLNRKCFTHTANTSIIIMMMIKSRRDTMPCKNNTIIYAYVYFYFFRFVFFYFVSLDSRERQSEMCELFVHSYTHFIHRFSIHSFIHS